MVTAPGIRVVCHELPGKAAEDGFPRSAIVAIIPHNQIRREIDVWVGVDVCGPEHICDDLLSSDGIANLLQSVREFPLERFDVCRFHAAGFFTANTVQIQPVQAQPEGSTSAPVDVMKIR